MNLKKINYIKRGTEEILEEKIPGENYLRFLYYNPLGKLSLNLLVKRKFLSNFYGKRMDNPSSKNKIEAFVKKYNINMEEFEKSVEDFTSFNDFFYRKLKNGARKIDYDHDVFVSHADGKILAFENIDKMEEYFVKGNVFTLEKFFNDRELSEKYQGGTLLIIRLAPVDYHRFHFPTNGTIGKSNLINGDYYSVSTLAVKENIRIFLENKREYSILKSDKFGDVAMFEVGASMVGGIKQTYMPDTYVKKGDEKGYFYFGGSTCILLLEKGKIKIDADLLENTRKSLETTIYMGEKIGIMY
ncbi:phosphatidylserine decarboxylase [Fusobacterium sp. PH5-44]|uniref:phosphatidylserine decarboxylase n=1 Tax=unclassified Fusobacterium TaxID=2648384 RepID=UPI003D2020FF